MKRYFLILLLTIAPITTATAVTDGGMGALKIVAELKAIYKQMSSQLSQLKTQNETLQAVRKGINDSVTTYYEIKNISLERIVGRIRKDIEGLTNLDDLSGMSMEKRIRVLQRELNRRIDDPKTSQTERERLQNESELLDSISKRSEILNEINDNATDNMAEASGDIGTKDSGRITAEGVSTLVQIEAMRELDRTELRRARLQDQKVMYNLNQQARKVVDDTKRGGW